MGIVDKAKDAAGKAKVMVDEQVDKHSDKIPDSVGKAYGKVSDAAAKVLPESGAEKSPSEKLIEGDADDESPAV